MRPVIKLANFSKESFMSYLLTLKEQSFLIKREDIYTLRNDWFTIGEHLCVYPSQRTCNSLFEDMHFTQSEEDYILSFNYQNKELSMLFKYHSTEINDYDIFYLNVIKKTTNRLFSSFTEPGVFFFDENCDLKHEMHFDPDSGVLNYTKMQCINHRIDGYFIIYKGIERSSHFLKIANIAIDTKTNLFCRATLTYLLNGKLKNIDYDSLIYQLPYLSEYTLDSLVDINNLHLKKDIPINERDIFLLEIEDI